MSQGTNPTYNGEGKTTLLNMIHSAPDKAELTGYKPYITGVLTSGDATDDAFLRNHLGRVYYSSLHYAGLDNLIGDSVDGSFRPITLTGLYEGTPGGGGVTDQFFSNVRFLSSFDGDDGDTTTSGLDESSSDLDLTYNSGDELSSDEKQFGTTSLFVADNVIISSSDGFNMGTGEFTIEGWWYFTSFSNSFSIYDQWNGSATGAGNVQMWMSHSAAGKVKWYYDGDSLLQSNTTMSTGQWYHIAFVRESGTLKMYFNGVLDSNTQSYSGQFGKTGTVFLGDQHAGGGGAPNYYVDELRVTKGIARYTANFTAPTSAFPES